MIFQNLDIALMVLTSDVILRLFSLLSITDMLSWKLSWNNKQKILSAKSGTWLSSNKNLECRKKGFNIIIHVFFFFFFLDPPNKHLSLYNQKILLQINISILFGPTILNSDPPTLIYAKTTQLIHVILIMFMFCFVLYNLCLFHLLIRFIQHYIRIFFNMFL